MPIPQQIERLLSLHKKAEISLPPLSEMAPDVRVLFVGRQATGKTTALNRIANTQFKTGLFGCTTEIQEVQKGRVTFVDTPGFDDPIRAVLALSPQVQEADYVVWFTDALQPCTHTERLVCAELFATPKPLFIVLSKLRFVPEEEHQAILSRVSTLAAPYHIEQVLPFDRILELHFPWTLRQIIAFAAALEQVPLPTPWTKKRLNEAWRSHVSCFFRQPPTDWQATHLVAPPSWPDGSGPSPKQLLPPKGSDSVATWWQVAQSEQLKKNRDRAALWLTQGHDTLSQWCEEHPHQMRRAKVLQELADEKKSFYQHKTSPS